MTFLTPTNAQLQEEIADLRLRLGAATETLEAIRNGEVDAILGGSEGDRVFTLNGADDPYRVLIEEMNQGAVTLAADGTILYCNRRFAELLQTPIDEIIGLSFASFVLPAERAVFAGMLGSACDGGSFGEMTLRGGNETAVPLQLALGCLPPEAVAAICLVATDIRESREKEARLRESMDALVAAERESELRATALAAVNADRDRLMLEGAKAEEGFRTMANNISQLAWMADATGYIFWYNDRWYDYSGTTFEEMAGWGWQKIHHPDHVQLVVDKITRCFENGEVWDQTFPLRGRDGNFRWFLSRAVPIRDAEGKVQRWFGTNTDITESKQLEEELAVARDQALESARMKSEFLANMSHEIRTPMNGILGMTELVLDSKLDAEQRGYLDMAHTSAQLLLSLINNILDFSKIEAGKLELEAIEFNLPAMIAQMLEPLNLRAKQKNLAVTVEIAGDVPEYVVGDAQRLRQVLLNFVDNALKFTERGSILVKVEGEAENARERYLHFSIADTGIGIPAEKQAVIFEAFAQVDGSTTRNYGGTGLGLAIASQLIEQMRGKVWIESVVGQGTTFHFTGWFGIRDAAAAASENAVERPTELLVPKAAPALRILLVEDNFINRALATALLQKRGHTLAQAANGQQAVDAAARESFDIIFMDVQLPEMDGYEATRSIRKMERETGHRTPIVAMTAHAMTGDRERCLAAGMDDYISKPLCREDLQRVLEGIPAVMPGEKPRAAQTSVHTQAELLELYDGDEALVTKLIRLFRDDSPKLLGVVRRAAASHDGPGLAAGAHKLLSSLGVFGAANARVMVLEIEEQGRHANFEGATKRVAQVTDEIEKIHSTLACYPLLSRTLNPAGTIIPGIPNHVAA